MNNTMICFANVLGEISPFSTPALNRAISELVRDNLISDKESKAIAIRTALRCFGSESAVMAFDSLWESLLAEQEEGGDNE